MLKWDWTIFSWVMIKITALVVFVTKGYTTRSDLDFLYPACNSENATKIYKNAIIHLYIPFPVSLITFFYNNSLGK